MTVIFCISMMLMTGCAKKAVSKDEGLVAGEKKAAAAQSEADIKKKEAEVAAKEEAARKLAAEQQKGDVKELALKRDAAATAAAEKEQTAFEDIYFAFDKSTIEPEAREILKRLASLLGSNKNYSLVIEGHCDERGTVEYNLALGQRRADAAMKYLVDLGLDKESIKTITYGKERPLDPGHDEEAWVKNRRAHFLTTLKK
ncbi:MAG: peptidoglycan-associated lipoprotein Pal [Deltaproteobacteria bacterium]|nr:peptidoglycan-associated lipoprotein Pal [Deltaproteobacteria bacterium]